MPHDEKAKEGKHSPLQIVTVVIVMMKLLFKSFSKAKVKVNLSRPTTVGMPVIWN